MTTARRGIDSLLEQVKPRKGNADTGRCIKSPFYIHEKLTECGEKMAAMTAASTAGRNFTRSRLRGRVRVFGDGWEMTSKALCKWVKGTSRRSEIFRFNWTVGPLHAAAKLINGSSDLDAIVGQSARHQFCAGEAQLTRSIIDQTSKTKNGSMACH